VRDGWRLAARADRRDIVAWAVGDDRLALREGGQARWRCLTV
jgi:hypothetical protein